MGIYSHYIRESGFPQTLRLVYDKQLISDYLLDTVYLNTIQKDVVKRFNIADTNKLDAVVNVQNKNGFIFSLMALNVLQHLLQSSTASDIQAAFAAIGISFYNFIVITFRIFTDGSRLILWRVFLMLRRHPNIHGCRYFVFVHWLLSPLIMFVAFYNNKRSNNV